MVALLTLALYVMTSYGLYTMAERREIKHSWIALVPVASLWLLAELACGKHAKILKMGYVPQILTGLAIACMIPGLGLIAAIPFIVYYELVLYQLYLTYARPFAKMLSLVSIVFPLVTCSIIFYLRDAKVILCLPAPKKDIAYE